LAVVLGRLIDSQALAGLQRDATRGVARVPDNTLERSSAVKAPPSRGDTLVGVYDAQGNLVVGKGPRHSRQAAGVVDGREHDGHDAGDLSVVVPVLSDTTVAGSVRAAVPLSLLHQRIYRAWVLLVGLALLVLAVAIGLARRSAQRISVPFEQLTLAARQLEQGRYDVHLSRFGMSEADAAADALRDSAREVEAYCATSASSSATPPTSSVPPSRVRCSCWAATRRTSRVRWNASPSSRSPWPTCCRCVA